MHIKILSLLQTLHFLFYCYIQKNLLLFLNVNLTIKYVIIYLLKIVINFTIKSLLFSVVNN